MLRRTSIVDSLKVDAIFFDSVIEIGDSNYIQSFSRALAIQRESEIFFGNEGDFNRYPVFSIPLYFQPIYEEVFQYTEHLQPVIKVNSIDITGASAAAVIHIGSSNHVSMESRLKHIRQLSAKKIRK